MRILLTGSNGQVGWELNRSLMALGEVVAFDRQGLDLSKPETIPGVIQSVKPDIIVNAAAYTAVDKAEEEEALATTINGTAVGVMAEEARKNNIFLLHYSTDYVFDGTKKTPYVEDDEPNPINAYGRSKLAGEQAIQQVGCDFNILRTTWVYSSRGRNFLKTILRLAKERDEVGIVDDQYGAPTWARNLADVSTLVLAKRLWLKREDQAYAKSGIFHATAAGETTWFGFAKSIIEVALAGNILSSKKPFNLKPIKTHDYPLPARRPENSRLSEVKLHSVYDLSLASWIACIKPCLCEV